MRGRSVDLLLLVDADDNDRVGEPIMKLSLDPCELCLACCRDLGEKVVYDSVSRMRNMSVKPSDQRVYSDTRNARCSLSRFN